MLSATTVCGRLTTRSKVPTCETCAEFEIRGKLECRWLQEFVVLILFDSPEVISTAKGISIGQMDFDNPKVDGVTSILYDLVIMPLTMVVMMIAL